MQANVYHIMEPGVWSQAALEDVEGVLAFRVHASQKELLDCYRDVSYMFASPRFCLFLSVEQSLDRAVAHTVISFLFHPKYHYIRNVPLILIQGKDSGVVSAELMAAAMAQGFEELSVKFPEAESKNSFIEYTPENYGAIRNVYKKLLLEEASIAGSLYLNVLKPEDVRFAEALLCEEEQKLQESYPVLFQLKQENQLLYERVNQLVLIQKAAEQELATQATHISTLRSISQAAHLQNYYTNEYEILPRWYKRFGHVLKVVMGKRSFRSLFNDNVKKYK